MKRRDFLISTAVITSAQLARGERPQQSANGDRIENWVKQHPRLYFNQQAIARLRQRIKADDGFKPRWSKLIERADALAQAELVTEAIARQPARRGNAARANYPQASGQISVMGMTLGLAYHVTGEERYAQKLRQALLHYAGYQQWCSPAYNTRNPPWNSELATGAFCLGAAAGYDALHDFLSVEERKRIAEAIARLGILPTLDDWVLPERRIHALDSMGHNWWSVCVSMAGVAAVALLGDDERAPEWVERVGDFFTHTLYPASSSFFTVNFGDEWSPERPVQSMRLLLANGLSSDATRWYVKRRDAGSSDPISLLYPANTGSITSPALPTSVIYPATGWAMLRSAWEDDATLLAVKSGTFWNHAHADAGSFMLFHAGRPLLIDSGPCDYSRPEYRSYYMQSRAHNVVLFNGQGQPDEDRLRGSKFSGQVHSLMDGLGVKYVYADATGPMARYLVRNYRHWLWLEGAILIFDDLLAHEAGRFDWLLHYEGTAQHKAGEVTLTNGPAKAVVRFMFPEQLTVREEQGLAERNPDQKRMYLSFSPATPAREQKFITAILPEVKGQSLPELELLRGPEMLGVRLRRAGQITEVYLNLQADGRRMHVNCNNVIDGWETDAYLLALTRPATSQTSTPQTMSRYFVSAGSYLRKGGQVVLDSLSQVTALFQAGQQMEVVLQGQELIEASLYCPAKPARLLLNGQEAKYSYDANAKLARLRRRSL